MRKPLATTCSPTIDTIYGTLDGFRCRCNRPAVDGHNIATDLVLDLLLEEVKELKRQQERYLTDQGYVKCPHCGDYDRKNRMFLGYRESTGKTARHFHPDCFLYEIDDIEDDYMDQIGKLLAKHGNAISGGNRTFYYQEDTNGELVIKPEYRDAVAKYRR